MYNFNFLDMLKNNNAVILFHNETVNIEENIISDIASIVAEDLRACYPERGVKESLLILQYPSIDSTDHTFNQFFDSPRCVSMMFSNFKGMFIVDCSKYQSIDNPQFNKLLDYIKENAGNDFKFVVLVRNQCKGQYSSTMKNILTTDLEISLSKLESYKENIDKDIYHYIIEEYKVNSQFRCLSASQIENCINSAGCSKDDFVKLITKMINEAEWKERRIGF